MPARLRPSSVTVLAVGTLLIWTGRLGLAWGTAGTTASKVAATVPVAIFVGFALVALVAVVRAPTPTLAPRSRSIALGLAVWTVAYWAVRLPFIWFDGRSVAFHLVHTALAAVSWAAAGWVLVTVSRAVRAPRPSSGGSAAPRSGAPATGQPAAARRGG